MTDASDVAAAAAELDNDPNCPKIMRPDIACEAWLDTYIMTSLAESLGLPKGMLPERGPTYREIMATASCTEQAKLAFISGYMGALEQLKAMALYKAKKLGIPIPDAEAEFGPMVPTVEAPTTKQ